MEQLWRNWMLASGFVLATSYLVSSCNDPGCIRNSQCPSGQSCLIGKCVVKQDAGAADGAALEDGGVVDGRLGDAGKDLLITDAKTGHDAIHDGVKPNDAKVSKDGSVGDGMPLKNDSTSSDIGFRGGIVDGPLPKLD